MLPIIAIVDKFFLVYTILIFIRIFSSWVPEWNNTRPMRFVAHYTDPYLLFFRRLIPPIGMLDISPIIALFSLNLIEWAVKTLILHLF